MFRPDLLDLSRQTAPGAVTPWFDHRLDELIADGTLPPPDRLAELGRCLIRQLADYREESGVGTAVLGMSGGVDSALTAALFQKAGWRVIGHTLPIHQNPEETRRGIEACQALDLEHQNLDLSAEYEAMVGALARLDPALAGSDGEAERTRRGNLRARLRMMTLYDQAHRHGGLVASTDNLSELAAGFWTLHGDVGDLAPIQSLLKSWEVPWLARQMGVPETTWRAKPTDGLGIGGGDEAQIGATYLEWDLTLLSIIQALRQDPLLTQAGLAKALRVEGDPRAQAVLQTVLRRLRRTWHKRANPIRLDHPLTDRYAQIEMLDTRLFQPATFRATETCLDFPPDLQVLAAELAGKMTARQQRLVTAESCTGGLLAASIAAVPGSSELLEGSFVTYSKEQKIAALGVPAGLIAERTVYDPEVARQMAQGALRASPRADLAISVTGVAGPGPDQGKPAGYVCIGLCRRGKEPVADECQFEGSPQAVLAATISTALRLVLSHLE